MNYVTVTGGNAKQREEVESIVNWCIKELMPRYRTLDVTIHLRDILMKEGAYGWCMPIDKREYSLDIHKKYKEFVKGKEDFVKTIMHEMVHVWQYATGTLKQTWGNDMVWKKKDYTGTPYSKQPWERQAHRMEDTLYAKWLSETK
jgi:hypothetical protein